MSNDMTVGRPARHILSFMLSIYAGLLFQQFYNIADSIIVSRLLGSAALGAVGSVGSIMFLINGFCNGFCSGCSMPVARSFGAKQYDRMRTYVGNSIRLVIITAVLITAMTTALCGSILTWMQYPEDIYDMSYSYLVVILCGIPVSMSYNLIAGFLRALGDSRTPLKLLIVSSLVNIVLTIPAIAVLHMGTAGAAIATVCAQGVSAVCGLIYVRRRCPLLHLTRDNLRYDWPTARTLLTNGIPMGLQFSVTAIGSVTLQSAVNSLGTAAVTAVTVGGKCSGVMSNAIDALGATMATFLGQNTGAGKYDRLKQGIHDAFLIGCAMCVVFLAIGFLLGDKFCMLFLSAEETDIIANAWLYLKWVDAFYILLVVLEIMRFGMQGMGFATYALISGFMEMIGRILAASVAVPLLGFTGACLGSPAAWIIDDIVLVPACFLCIRHLYKERERNILQQPAQESRSDS